MKKGSIRQATKIRSNSKVYVRNGYPHIKATIKSRRNTKIRVKRV